MTHSKMRLIVASNNSNKLREFHEILGERFDIVSMHEAGIDADIEESGTTFEENALIKANYVMNACHCAAIADADAALRAQLGQLSQIALQLDRGEIEPKQARTLAAYTARDTAADTATTTRITHCCFAIWKAFLRREKRDMSPRLRWFAPATRLSYAAAHVRAKF